MASAHTQITTYELGGVTSGLLLATPKGCFPLKSLFSVSLATDEGDSKAAAAVRNMIEATSYLKATALPIEPHQALPSEHSGGT